MTQREELALFRAMIDATTVEMIGVFDAKELAILGQILAHITLDVAMVEDWSAQIGRQIEKAVRLNRLEGAHGIDLKSTVKKVKGLTVLQSAWLVEEVKEKQQAA